MYPNMYIQKTSWGKVNVFSMIKLKENHGRKNIAYLKILFFFSYGLLFPVLQGFLSLNRPVGEVFLTNYPTAAVPFYLLSISNQINYIISSV